MTIEDLILESGGLTENVYRYKIEIARVNPEELNDEVFSKVINTAMNNKFFLYIKIILHLRMTIMILNFYYNLMITCLFV